MNPSWLAVAIFLIAALFHTAHDGWLIALGVWVLIGLLPVFFPYSSFTRMFKSFRR